MNRRAPVLTISLIVLVTACAAPSPQATSSPAGSATPGPTPAACQPTEPACSGPLAPGVHTTANLIIPLTFEVPAGWSKRLDVPGSVNLASTEFPARFIGILPDWAIANQERCTPEPAAGLGRTVSDLVIWLAEHPGLIASTPAPTELGGLEGQLIDVRKDPNWSGPCAGVVSLFTHTGTINDPGWWDINDSTQMRLYVLDAGGGHTVTVHVETGDQASFESFAEAAAPILGSFEFGAPAP